MNKGLLLIFGILLFLGACVQRPLSDTLGTLEATKLNNKFAPDDHFFMQRSYPDTAFPMAAYNKALEIARADYLRAKNQLGQRSGNSLVWESEGPGNIGGRINTIAVDPTNPSIIYVGTACGGVFKTTNAGATWAPIFDDQPYLSIGDIEIDPSNHNTIYVGTGDPNISGYPFIGDGVYKSTDAGQTWTNLGLVDQRIVSKLEVHPLNPNLIYAGTMGLPFQKNNQRGLYKSTDGGQNWNQVYYKSDSAGIIDMVLHPTDTNIIYITGWNRIRNSMVSLLTGPDCQILKSTDAGQTWQPIMSGIPNTSPLSRINIDMSASDPNLLFASVVNNAYDLQGIYKTTNGGQTWVALPNNGLPTDALGGFGWYFGHVKVNPANNNELFLLGVDLYRSSDGGINWTMAGPPWYTYDFHADKHDLVFDGNTIYCGTDGGLYASTDRGDTWLDIENLPVTQFYHVAINPHNPGVYYGGAQDNGTCVGNKASINQWGRIFGGDGFDIQFHPLIPDIFYVETQNGAIYTTDDGGNYIYDAVDGIDNNDRRNWDMPYLLSNFNPDVLYTGTYRMYKSTNGNFPFWQPISNDLTKGPIWGEGRNNISVVEESKLVNDRVFCGTSDGNVWRTIDGGNNWTSINATLPNRYVTDLESSSLTAGLLMVSHSGYKDNDFIPHIHLSRNDGDTWTDISGNLPPIAINEIEISNLNDSLIFVATDGGVYYTVNQGAYWERLGSNMPVMIVYDLKIDALNQKLIAGTHARSVLSIPIDSINANLFVAPIVTNISGDDTVCTGGTSTLNATGGSFVNWSPSAGLSCTACATTEATPSITTTYYANVSNGTSSAIDSFTVVVLPSLSPPVIQVFTDSLVVSNPDPSASGYQWYLNNSPILGANLLNYLVTESGSYSVAVTREQCTASSNSTYITIISAATLTSISEPTLWSYNNTVYAISPQGSALHTFELYGVSGQLLVQEEFVVGFYKNLSNLSSGTYIARIVTDKGTVTRKIFVR